MNPTLYDAWYDSPRGRWIGETEYRLAERELALRPDTRVLDVGCGTGWFTRCLARRGNLEVTAIDIDSEWLEYARSRDCHSRYIRADALALPFADNSFDAVLSIAALCFTSNWQKAAGEIVRVCRGRFAIGMLNRHSLLWHEKGRNSGQGAYLGARWVDARELLNGLAGLPVKNPRVRSAVFFPSGSLSARCMERLIPNRLAFGGIMLLMGEKSRF